MESFTCRWHCFSFHLTGSPLHSLLGPSREFRLCILDAPPQLSPEPFGCAFSTVSLTLSTLKVLYRLYWTVTFTFKFLALRTLCNTAPVYSHPAGGQLFRLRAPQVEPFTPLQPVPFPILPAPPHSLGVQAKPPAVTLDFFISTRPPADSTCTT